MTDPNTREGAGSAEIIAELLAAMGGREAFQRGFDARSHFPEKLAARTLQDAAELLEAGLQDAERAGATPEMAGAWKARFVRLWVQYQHSGARVMNWFITGPARFPVERNRKRMETERKRGDEFYAHAKGAGDWVRRQLRSVAKAELSAVAADVAHSETEFPGGRLVRNTTLDRVQLVFDGRPSPQVIAQLKSRAFRWSPREGAWQRQLTRNGVWAAEAVVSSLAQQETHHD